MLEGHCFHFLAVHARVVVHEEARSREVHVHVGRIFYETGTALHRQAHRRALGHVHPHLLEVVVVGRLHGFQVLLRERKHLVVDEEPSAEVWIDKFAFAFEVKPRIKILALTACGFCLLQVLLRLLKHGPAEDSRRTADRLPPHSCKLVVDVLENTT